MSARSRFIRFAAGSVVVFVVVTICFTILLTYIHRWGATEAEVSRILPGDELLTEPMLEWTHGITIGAPPERVWPWIAQIGDTRAGFYSYTLIENNLFALAPDYQVRYQNANSLVEAWQNPVPGDQIIQGALRLHSLEFGRWMLAESVDPEAFGWTWLWKLEPLNEGEHTRLLVRMKIKAPPEARNPILSFGMDIGGFVMENRMLQGIKLRAQGGNEPPYLENLELSIWLSVLIVGLSSGFITLFQKDWRKPLLSGVVSIVSLFYITFVQPEIVLRLLILSLLLLMLVWSRQESLMGKQEKPAKSKL